MCREQQADDAQPRRRSHGDKHFRIPIHIFIRNVCTFHISTIPEIPLSCKPKRKRLWQRSFRRAIVASTTSGAGIHSPTRFVDGRSSGARRIMRIGRSGTRPRSSASAGDQSPAACDASSFQFMGWLFAVSWPNKFCACCCTNGGSFAYDSLRAESCPVDRA